MRAGAYEVRDKKEEERHTVRKDKIYQAARVDAANYVQHYTCKKTKF